MEDFRQTYTNAIENTSRKFQKLINADAAQLKRVYFDCDMCESCPIEICTKAQEMQSEIQNLDARVSKIAISEKPTTIRCPGSPIRAQKLTLKAILIKSRSNKCK